jgi:hypothetical protein
LVEGEEELAGRRKMEAVEVGEEVRRMMALGVEVVRLIEAMEVAGEHWIVVKVVEEVHWIVVKAVEVRSIEAKEEAGVRCLFLVEGGQVEKMLEVMEEHLKMVPKVFWEAVVEEECLLVELRERDHGTVEIVFLMHEVEGVVLGLSQEFWEVH